MTSRRGRSISGEQPDAYYNPLIRRLVALPIPVVCAVNGVAAGAGVSLALACDVVIARSSARFVQAFSSIGLVPDAGGTWNLPRLVGQARALGFTLTGGTLSAATAAEWGLIWKAIDDEHFEAEREALVEQLSRGPTKGLAERKTCHPPCGARRHSTNNWISNRSCSANAD